MRPLLGRSLKGMMGAAIILGTLLPNIDPAQASLASAVLPSSRSVQVGSTAIACGLSLLTPIPGTFSYQMTDPLTNTLTGSPDTPVDRPSGDYKVSTSTEVERTVSFILEKGQTRFIRWSISMGFFVRHVYGE